MELYPAIDLRDGRCVRLYQGDFERETVYGDDPVEVAIRFCEQGARWIHVVDLDAARTGEPRNRALIAAIAGAVPAAVQGSGGVRDEAAAEALFEAGVSRVVIGTSAVHDPDLVSHLAARWPVALGLDVRGTEVAVRGWQQGSGIDVFDALDRFADAGVQAVVVTQIGQDGTLHGPDVDGLTAVLEATPIDVIASGGVGSLDDLRALAALSARGRRLAGTIVGRAVHDGVFSVAQAVEALNAKAGDGEGRNPR